MEDTLKEDMLVARLAEMKPAELDVIIEKVKLERAKKHLPAELQAELNWYNYSETYCNALELLRVGISITKTQKQKNKSL